MIFIRRGDAAVYVHAETAKVRDQICNLSISVNALPREPQLLPVQAKKLCKPPCAFMSLLWLLFFFFCRQVMQSVLIKNLLSKPFISLLKEFKGVKISICQSQDGAMHLTHHLCCTVQCFNCTAMLTFHWNQINNRQRTGEPGNKKHCCKQAQVSHPKSLGGVYSCVISVALLSLWLN